MDDVQEWPKLTPYLARRADSMCPLRLLRDYEGKAGNAGAFTYWRVREPLLAALQAAHASLAAPAAADIADPVGLVVEELALFRHAAATYTRLFTGRPGRAADHGCDRPSPLPRRQVRLGGGVDLIIERPDGTYELRQFSLWGAALPADPLDAPHVRLAVLRLSRSPLSPLRELHVVLADLVRANLRERHLHLPADITPLATWLDERLTCIAERTADPVPAPGADCGTCVHVPMCPAHR